MKLFINLFTIIFISYQAICSAGIVENLAGEKFLEVHQRHFEDIAVNSAVLEDLLSSTRSKFISPSETWVKEHDDVLTLFSVYNSFWTAIDYNGPHYGTLWFFSHENDNEYLGNLKEFTTENENGKCIVHDLEKFMFYTYEEPPHQVMKVK